MRASEAGFTLIEVLLATALFGAVALGAVETVRQLAAHGRTVVARDVAYGALERLTAQWRSEARSAAAVWIGSAAAGGDHDGCVEIDLYAAGAEGPRFWAYRQFPNHAPGESPAGDALERLTASAPFAACDPALHGSTVLRGLRASLTAQTIAAPALAAHRDGEGTLDAPFVAAGVPEVAPPGLGVLDAAGAEVSGGNAIVELAVETEAGVRAVDLLPGVFPSAYTEVLEFACSERCDVGHDSAGPKTLTACALSWQPGWSSYVAAVPGGWFVAGTFVFTYAGTRSSDGGTDTAVARYPASNWDPARDYAASPPDRPLPDGSLAGSFAPWDVRAEPAAAWLADFGPFLARGQAAPIAVEQRRCDAVDQAGTSGGFYPNG